MTRKTLLRSLALPLAGLMTLGACNRVQNIGQTPEMTAPVQTAELEAMANPPLDLPKGPATPDAGASLFASSPTSLVGDRRAQQRGDILTVVIQIDDKAEMQNSSGRSRNAADSVGIDAMAGLPQRLDPMLPEGASLAQLAKAKGASSFKGTGSISRRDKLTLRVAATVVDRLPNGVLRIEGTQEVRVNYELRELTVSGFVRPQDIGRNNEIAYDRIAGARISYGGRGQISDVQQPRYGQQVADILLPW